MTASLLLVGPSLLPSNMTASLAQKSPADLLLADHAPAPTSFLSAPPGDHHQLLPSLQKLSKICRANLAAKISRSIDAIVPGTSSSGRRNPARSSVCPQNRGPPLARYLSFLSENEIKGAALIRKMWEASENPLANAEKVNVEDLDGKVHEISLKSLGGSIASSRGLWASEEETRDFLLPEVYKHPLRLPLTKKNREKIPLSFREPLVLDGNFGREKAAGAGKVGKNGGVVGGNPTKKEGESSFLSREDEEEGGKMAGEAEGEAAGGEEDRDADGEGEVADGEDADANGEGEDADGEDAGVNGEGEVADGEDAANGGGEVADGEGAADGEREMVPGEEEGAAAGAEEGRPSDSHSDIAFRLGGGTSQAGGSSSSFRNGSSSSFGKKNPVHKLTSAFLFGSATDGAPPGVPGMAFSSLLGRGNRLRKNPFPTLIPDALFARSSRRRKAHRTLRHLAKYTAFGAKIRLLTKALKAIAKPIFNGIQKVMQKGAKAVTLVVKHVTKAVKIMGNAAKAAATIAGRAATKGAKAAATGAKAAGTVALRVGKQVGTAAAKGAKAAGTGALRVGKKVGTAAAKGAKAAGTVALRVGKKVGKAATTLVKGGAKGAKGGAKVAKKAGPLAKLIKKAGAVIGIALRGIKKITGVALRAVKSGGKMTLKFGAGRSSALWNKFAKSTLGKKLMPIIHGEQNLRAGNCGGRYR